MREPGESSLNARSYWVGFVGGHVVSGRLDPLPPPLIPASRHKVITAQELVAKLNIRGFYNSDTPAHLREIVRAMSNDSRQRFVSFITASTVLPPGDQQITITHVSWGPERLPLAHTCFDRLD